MNFIQKLLGIDQLLLALSSVKSLQAELAETKERNKQYEERNRRHEEEIAQLKQQLQQKAENLSKKTAQAVAAEVPKPSEQSSAESADKMKIAELEERCRKLSEALSDPQAVFLAHLKRGVPTEEKKGRGQPRIDGKNINLRLDLDLSIITEEVASARGKSVTSVINEGMRYYLSALHADMFTRLAQPRGREYQPFDPIGESGRV